jgi:hypothetical protein
VHETDWFYGSVRYVRENGIMEGTSATAFSPSASLTRAMVATILWRMEGSPVPTTPSAFTDLVADWYEDAVAWASAQGIAMGYEDGTFRPGQPVSRQELAAFLYRYAQTRGAEQQSAADLDAFSDAGEIAAWARDAMGWAVAGGVMQGKGGGLIAPAATATRAEAAAMMERFMAMPWTRA